jgi:hypothetical protein
VFRLRCECLVSTPGMLRTTQTLAYRFNDLRMATLKELWPCAV